VDKTIIKSSLHLSDVIIWVTRLML